MSDLYREFSSESSDESEKRCQKKSRRKESSDASHVLSDLLSDSSIESVHLKKKRKVVKRKGAMAPAASSGKRMKTNLTKSQNHDDFFKNLEEASIKLHDSSEESSQSTDFGSESNRNSNENDLYAKLDRRLENISHQNAHEMSELKRDMVELKRMVAKVEVLVKCRKENDSPDTGADYLMTLKSYGLPIDTKENFDALERKLENEAEKSQLVCV